jgi:hypothetical protein
MKPLQGRYVNAKSVPAAIAFGFFTHWLQAEKLIQAASASFSTRKSAFLRAMYEQISTVRSQIQIGSGSFCNSDVKKIPNAIALAPLLLRQTVDGLSRTFVPNSSAWGNPAQKSQDSEGHQTTPFKLRVHNVDESLMCWLAMLMVLCIGVDSPPRPRSDYSFSLSLLLFSSRKSRKSCALSKSFIHCS